MKKLTALVLAWICIVGSLVGCSKASKESTYQPVAVENISISITDISSSGASITIKDTNEDPYVYGQWYKIEKEVNGKWYEVETNRKNYGFTEEGHIVGENDELNFHIDWKWLYGELPTGQYRLLKQVDNKYISVEFDIV